MDDVAEAIVAILAARLGSPVRPALPRAERINLASGEEISVLELAALIKAALGSEKPVLCRGAPRPGDPRRWRADATRLHELLAPWRPRSPRESLPACVAAWQAGRGGNARSA